MKKIRNKEVIQRFVTGRFGYDGYGNVKSTDDGKLYSYSVVIAEWNPDGYEPGQVVVYDKWDGHSPTTSKHFKFLHDALVRGVGINRFEPPEWTATHETHPDATKDCRGRKKNRWVNPEEYR